MTQDQVLSKIKHFADQDSEISALWLYGSRARGDQTPDSDYDLAVSFFVRATTPIEAVLRPQRLMSVWGEELLSEAVTLSVVDIGRAPTPLAVNIINDGTLLVDKTPKETAWLYKKIWSKWEDWQYLKRA